MTSSGDRPLSSEKETETDRYVRNVSLLAGYPNPPSEIRDFIEKLKRQGYWEEDAARQVRKFLGINRHD